MTPIGIVLTEPIVLTPGGCRRIRHGRSILGEVQVTDTYQAVVHEGEVMDYWLTLREAELDGNLVTDPGTAAALAQEAGIGDAPMWLGKP